jgi:hypothetical protein
MARQCFSGFSSRLVARVIQPSIVLVLLVFVPFALFLLLILLYLPVVTLAYLTVLIGILMLVIGLLRFRLQLCVRLCFPL